MTKKRLCNGLLAIGTMFALAALWVNSRINGSLATLDGTVAVVGIESDVQVDRDALGIPTITATSRIDAAFALGFLHAQDRFFQMDLLRRQPAGRLSELFGEATFDVDVSYRLHRFEKLAQRVIAQSESRHLKILSAYTSGINAGLNELAAPPFEYLVLQATPVPWKVEDCVLVAAAMFCDLQDETGEQEITLGRFKENLPPTVFEFLNRRGTKWDSPLVGDAFTAPPIPPKESWLLGERARNRAEASAGSSKHSEPELLTPGSNSWAVDGKHTVDGRAILANDMHLGHSVPNIWYRAVIKYPDTATGKSIQLVGATLPGTPTLIVGSNGSVAWGLTNAAADFGDIIELKLLDENMYATPDGPRRIESVQQRFELIGEPSRTMEQRWTKWGPIVQETPNLAFVHRWIGYDTDAANFNFFDMENTTSVQEAIEIANNSGVVHTNIVCIDSQGNIGWTIAGRIPRRTDAPPRVPVDWSERERWTGYLDSHDYPKIINPEDGIIWTANQRVVDEAGLELLGEGSYALGARATQIRSRLMQKETFNEQDMLSIQLDDEAIFLRNWREVLLAIVKRDKQSVSTEFVDFVNNWGGHAAVDSVGYRIVRRFRERVIDEITAGIAGWYGLSGRVPLQPEGFVWQLIEKRPEHLVPAEEATWDDFLSRVATDTESDLTTTGAIAEATWGTRNTTLIQHPLSVAIPQLSSWLDMPIRQLPGDSGMPRVQRPNFGASQRMVVSPGHEADSIFHMPGGQSGHPRSPFYRAGFEDWVEGRPTPLLPGPIRHKLTLKP